MTERLPARLLVTGAVAAVLTGLGFCNLLAVRDVDISPLALPRLAKTPAVKQPQPETSDPTPAPVAEEAVLTRPVFSPSRLPYVPPPPAVMTPQSVVVVQPPAPPVIVNPPKIKLLGIRKFDGVTSALVGIDEQTPDWVTVGDQLGGWQIESVDDSELKIRLIDRHIVYDLYQGSFK